MRSHGPRLRSRPCATIRRHVSCWSSGPTTGRRAERRGNCLSDELPCPSCAGRLAAESSIRSTPRPRQLLVARDQRAPAARWLRSRRAGRRSPRAAVVVRGAALARLHHQTSQDPARRAGGGRVAALSRRPGRCLRSRGGGRLPSLALSVQAEAAPAPEEGEGSKCGGSRRRSWRPRSSFRDCSSACRRRTRASLPCPTWHSATRCRSATSPARARPPSGTSTVCGGAKVRRYRVSRSGTSAASVRRPTP